jgi:hypothetical protein
MLGGTEGEETKMGTLAQPPDQKDAIMEVVYLTFLICCQICSVERTADCDTREDAALCFLTEGWRRRDTERGAYIVCPDCAMAKGRR